MVTNMLLPLVEPIQTEKELQQDQLKATTLLNQVLKHLACNNNYYTGPYNEKEYS